MIFYMNDLSEWTGLMLLVVQHLEYCIVLVQVVSFFIYKTYGKNCSWIGCEYC